MTLIHDHARAPRSGSLLRQIRFLFAVHRQRRILEQMSDAQLRDIGLSRSEAHEEARRVFWDAPQHWRI